MVNQLGTSNIIADIIGLYKKDWNDLKENSRETAAIIKNKTNNLKVKVKSINDESPLLDLLNIYTANDESRLTRWLKLLYRFQSKPDFIKRLKNTAETNSSSMTYDASIDSDGRDEVVTEHEAEKDSKPQVLTEGKRQYKDLDNVMKELIASFGDGSSSQLFRDTYYRNDCNLEYVDLVGDNPYYHYI